MRYLAGLIFVHPSIMKTLPADHGLDTAWTQEPPAREVGECGANYTQHSSTLFTRANIASITLMLLIMSQNIGYYKSFPLIEAIWISGSSSMAFFKM